MTATLIDGRAAARDIRDEVAGLIAAMTADGLAPPTLHTVLCGDAAASDTYMRSETRAALRLGMRTTVHRRPPGTTTEELVALVRRLNADPTVDAVMVELPLPPPATPQAVLAALDPLRDADGCHPDMLGRIAVGHAVVNPPSTPAACLELLRRGGVDPSGRRVVVVGRSTVVGRPLALMLTNVGATVTVCHSRTRELASICAEAEILVSAAGHPGLITREHLRPGACVIDVGTTPSPDGVVHGDVDAEAAMDVAGLLTPVPGGVGPVTVAMLLRNVVTLARERRGGLDQVAV